MSLLFKVLKIFVFLLSMQALRHSGCWVDNKQLHFLLDNNEYYAFIGIKWSAFGVLSPYIES